MDALTDFAKQSKKNTEALQTVVETQNATVRQYNMLVDITRQEEERADRNYDLYVREYNAHQSDRRWFEVEKLFWQALAVIGLAL